MIDNGYDIGQRVRLADGTEGHISRKTKVRLFKGFTFSYWIVKANGDLVGDGRMVYIGHESSIEPIGEPLTPIRIDDGTRQSLIPGLESMVSEKAKKRQRAA